MTKTNAIDPNTPAGSSERKLGDDAIRDQAKGVAETLNVDHYIGSDAGAGSGYNEDDAGEHKQVTFQAPRAKPDAVAASQAVLYTKDDASSKAELHFCDEDENEIQLTQQGAIQGVPVGSVIPYCGAAAPAGWLLCDGTAYNGTTSPKYAALFGVIANTYGGSSIADFEVPDLRGYFIRGLDTTQEVDPDYASRTLGSTQADAIIAHRHHQSHSAIFNGAGDTNAARGDTAIQDTSDTYYSSGPYDASTPTTYIGKTETRPKNIALNYIIKY